MSERSEDGEDRPGPDGSGSDGSEQLALMQQMVDLSVERTRLAEQRTQLAQDRTRMAADRSEMSAERSYMNAERTLSVWIRTALAVMVVGIAVDRFGLFLLEKPGEQGGGASDGAAAGLVALGVLMSAVTGLRFYRYSTVYRRTHELPHHHGPFLAPVFAVLVALFGVALLILLLIAQ